MSAPAAALPRTGIGRFSDIFLAAAVLFVVAMMIIPLPQSLLDLLLAMNLGLAITVLLISMYTREPLQFSSFPSLLLLLTLYRLGLNVSATRLILLQGHAGKVIEAFGNFVMGGNYVVGIVVFLILMIIQFIVITNGAGRVAEVAARFTLDAMPGKQMSIDADLNAGLLNEDQARKRRQAIEQEADFYGAMDGASKFVKGDAIASIAIVLVNILGGFAIGVIQLNMPLAQALQTYTLLTVGEGLVAQIPALLISTASGIIVTRVGSESHLGADVGKQLSSNPRVLGMVSALLCAFSLVPGLPMLPFLSIGGLVGVLAFVVRRSQAAQALADSQPETARPADAAQADDMQSLLQVDPLEVEIGFGLVPLANPGAESSLLNRVSAIRRQTAIDLGIILPKIRVRDNLRLEAQQYVFKLRGEEIARGELMTNYFLAIASTGSSERLEGIDTTEPAFGLPAKWISAGQKAAAELGGYTVVDPLSVLTTHLSEVIKRHAADILGRQDVQTLLDNLKTKYPSILDHLVPEPISLSDMHKVLRNLLRERVSVRDLVTVLETLAAHAPESKDTDYLTERVRQGLARSLSNQYRDSDGMVHALTLNPNVENLLAASMSTDPQAKRVRMEPSVAQSLIERTGQAMERLAAQGRQPLVLCSAAVRLPFRRLTERSLPNLAVLSYSEIVPQVEVFAEGMIEAA
ncbi:MAG: flagellar biosynthesis protein FlhA [Chloroflexi bacterium]|nr:flagellar biosynthesis protein FlhA [Chloroflexota bacterium]